MFVYPRENDWEVWKRKTPPATPDSHAALHMVEDSCALEPLVSRFKTQTQAPAALLGFLISQLHKNELRCVCVVSPPPRPGTELLESLTLSLVSKEAHANCSWSDSPCFSFPFVCFLFPFLSSPLIFNTSLHCSEGCLFFRGLACLIGVRAKKASSGVSRAS